MVQRCNASYWVLLTAFLAACGGGGDVPEPTTAGRDRIATAMSVSAEVEDAGVQRLAAAYYDRKYGVGVEEAQRRLAIQDRAAGIEDALERVLGAQYAGVWFAPQDRGRLKVGMTAEASRRQSDVRAVLERFGLAADADLVAVRFTEGELEAKVDELRRAAAELVERGRARVGYATDSNRVVLTAVRDLGMDEQALVDRLAARDDVVLRSVATPTLRGRLLGYSCAVRRCDPPLRGGREIFAVTPLPLGSFLDIDIAKLCTAAFLARHRVTQEWLMMTAGHCLANPLFSTWSTTDQSDTAHVIGGTYGWMWGGGFDAGVVGIDMGGYWGNPMPQPWVVVKASDDTAYNPAYKIKSDGKSSLYTIKCTTGRTTGSHCGEVIGLGLTVVFDAPGGGSVVVNNLGVIDKCVSEPGDSGGPVYKKNVAYGILIGGTVFPDPACDEFYQGIRGAENVLNVDVQFAP